MSWAQLLRSQLKRPNCYSRPALSESKRGRELPGAFCRMKRTAACLLFGNVEAVEHFSFLPDLQEKEVGERECWPGLQGEEACAWKKEKEEEALGSKSLAATHGGNMRNPDTQCWELTEDADL